jgi:hypothetical protein
MNDATNTKWATFDLLKALNAIHGGQFHDQFARIAAGLGLELPAVATPAPVPTPGREEEAVGEPSDPDILGRWIDACLDLSDPSATMSLADLFARWSQWAEREKAFAGSVNASSRALVKRWGVERKNRGEAGIFFTGVRLTEPTVPTGKPQVL